ncbi:MAG: hypothetical protein P1R58_12990 [bacterium]|nr:hypothetical protein [bacterium]
MIFLLLVAGCGSMATRNKFYQPITAELHRDNFQSAVEKIEAAKADGKYGEKDHLIYYIDAGLAYYYAGNYDSSRILLLTAHDAADELFTKSISRAATSVLLNDNALEYAGEDYELLYLNLINAMNFLSMGDFDGAFVEVRRANHKLEMLENKYAEAAAQMNRGSREDTAAVSLEYEPEKTRFNNDAFARWLSMHMYAADGKFDDAEIDRTWLNRAFKEQPHIYDFDQPDVKYRSSDGAVLSVVALTGESPRKEALSLRLRTDKDLDLVQILYTDSENEEETEYGHLPLPVSEDFYFKFAMPKMVTPPSIVSRIRISVDGESIGDLHLIDDIGKIAEDTFRARKSLIYIRTIMRALFKGLATHKLKKKADTGGLGGWLKKAAIDIGTDLTENADLRSSRLLPSRVYVGDFEIEPGQYNITVDYFDSTGQIIKSEILPDFPVNNSNFNLVQTVSLN